MQEFHIKDLESLPAEAEKILKTFGNRNVIAFDAPMGAGKTTLIAAICSALGVEDATSSPTFAIVNDYTAADGRRICHFDCYRLSDPREAEDMGIEDYFYSDALCLIEWPDRIEPFLPADTLVLTIRVNPDNSRTVLLQ
ncbi:MAG: tRNA (adenosine(37)-N6)-threonylcarbamoyltransferase complex ATPase subunit type 1 TsaE [Muribaculaceae bacterium]|nr:tRNA (adenosine(37)-N6)-threonylcarbamoyltransferase complex ATPase subunit type 1 TsaE [Muribaculaceae bacterium]